MRCFDLSVRYQESQSCCRVQHLPSFTLKTKALNKSTSAPLPPLPFFLSSLVCVHVCMCAHMHVEAQLLSPRLLVFEAGLVIGLELAR